MLACLGNEQIMQICPVQLNIWSAVLTLVLRRERKGLDDLAGIVQTKNVCPRLYSNPRNRFSKTQIAKNVHGIGADLNAGTNLAEFRRRFVDIDVATRLQHGERRGEPADAAADYCYLETHPKPQCAFVETPQSIKTA